jgi:hypothetical protein
VSRPRQQQAKSRNWREGSTFATPVAKIRSLKDPP